jgi:hypothetical protein
VPDDHTPKIIVDDDWKSQARAEKERLAQQTAPKPPAPKPSTPGASPGPQAAGQAGAADGAGDGPDPEGPLGFADLVRLLTTQALMYMGAFPDPQTGQAMIALDAAKAHIDLLGVVEEKTKGNLSDDEKAMLTGTLHELRLQFVEIVRAVDKAVAEGRLGRGAAGAVAPVAPPAPGMPPLRM